MASIGLLEAGDAPISAHGELFAHFEIRTCRLPFQLRNWDRFNDIYYTNHWPIVSQKQKVVSIRAVKRLRARMINCYELERIEMYRKLSEALEKSDRYRTALRHISLNIPDNSGARGG